MALSTKARKILWGRSGNVCAFPGCPQHLAYSSANQPDTIVIGEECHIYARAADGPRGVLQNADVEVDSHLNVILLCPTHHRIIDSQPDVFTVTALRDMKASHERRVRDSQRAFDTLNELKTSGYENVCSGDRVANAWRFGPSLLVACSFGSDPILLKDGRWQCGGIVFRHIQDSRSETLLTSSEAEPDVQYWTEDQVLYVVQDTYEPESKSLVPFIENRFDLCSYPAMRSQYLLLSEFPGSIAEFPKIIERLMKSEYDPSVDYESLLYRLRNIGLSEPEYVLKQISALRSMKWYDGAAAETATSVVKELEIVRSIKLSGSNEPIQRTA